MDKRRWISGSRRRRCCLEKGRRQLDATMCHACGNHDVYNRDCPHSYFPPTLSLGTGRSKGKGNAFGDEPRHSRREGETAAKAKEKAPARTDSVNSGPAAANVATNMANHSFSARSGSRPMRYHRRNWQKSSSWERMDGRLRRGEGASEGGEQVRDLGGRGRGAGV